MRRNREFTKQTREKN